MSIVIEVLKLHSQLRASNVVKSQSFHACQRRWRLLFLAQEGHMGVYLRACKSEHKSEDHKVKFKVILHLNEDLDSNICRQESTLKHFADDQDRGWAEFVSLDHLAETSDRPLRFEVDIVGTSDPWNTRCSERYFEPLASDAPECTQEELKSALEDTLKGLLREAGPTSREWKGEPSLYTGSLGVAFMCFRLHKAGFPPVAEPWLDLCAAYMRQAAKSSKDLQHAGMSFVLGWSGMLALQCAYQHSVGDKEEATLTLRQLQSEEDRVLRERSNEILYGKAGYLAALLFLEREVGLAPAAPLKVLRALIDEGRARAQKSGSPDGPSLAYVWHDTPYLGGAHGLAGILQMMLHWVDALSEEDQKTLLDSVHWLQAQAFPSGNFPSKEGAHRDELVHWCHGATGTIPLLTEAYQTFRETTMLSSAHRAATVVWERGLLRKGVGLCHGVSGSGYAFLNMYRLLRGAEEGQVYLRKAKQFAKFMIGGAGRGGWRRLTECGAMRTPDSPYSLFEGQAGQVCFFLDLWSKPIESAMPC